MTNADTLSASFFFLFTAGMTGTSFELLVRNLTQVEKLGIKSRVGTMAILEPSDYVSRFGVNSNYYKITYPLGAGEAPSEERGPVPDGRPMVKVYDHTERPHSDWSQAPILPASGSIDGTSQHTGPNAMTVPNVPLEAQLSVQQPQVDQAQVPEVIASKSQQPVSDRDRQATRTFAILNMVQAGENPWDLGSALANWESVMGYHVIDWFLPIRRSPCCNHEDSESHFMVGPAVDRVRVAVTFHGEEDSPDRGQRLKKQRKDLASRDTDRRTQEKHVQQNGSTEMRHLN